MVSDELSPRAARVLGPGDLTMLVWKGEDLAWHFHIFARKFGARCEDPSCVACRNDQDEDLDHALAAAKIVGTRTPRLTRGLHGPETASKEARFYERRVFPVIRDAVARGRALDARDDAQTFAFFENLGQGSFGRGVDVALRGRRLAERRA